VREVIAAAGTIAAMAATWMTPAGGAGMVGLLPPHYGYSAYFESAALLCATWPEAQGLCLGAMLISTNRCSWVGALVGWGYLGGRRRRAVAAVLVVLAVVLGARLKPHPYNDAVRLDIWRAVAASPGVGSAAFAAVRVDGHPAAKAHSDLLQLYVHFGARFMLIAGALMLLALDWLLDGERLLAVAVVLCLTAQSLLDNRLHHPACAALYALAWWWAISERRRQRPPPGLPVRR
jgi:hypothetical protein